MIKHCLTPIVSGLLLAALVAGCAVNPVTGRNELSLFDETQEINLGTNQYGPTQQSQGGPYTADPELSEYVSKVGQRLARVSDRSLPYEFIIIDDSTPNAWALPGGKIGINRGLLVRLNSEAELAAVLSHEIVHAAARHSAKSIERGLLVDGVLNAAGAALESSNVNYAGIVQDGARLGSQMLLQSYGREAELESDAYGMIYMLRAGYDPEAAVSLQETFVALSSGRSSDWLSGLLASHPPSLERVAKNRARAVRLHTNNTPLELGFERYQGALANLTRQSKAYDLLEEAGKAWAQGNLANARDKASEAKRLQELLDEVDPDEESSGDEANLDAILPGAAPGERTTRYSGGPPRERRRTQGRTICIMQRTALVRGRTAAAPGTAKKATEGADHQLQRRGQLVRVKGGRSRESSAIVQGLVDMGRGRSGFSP